jgi:hypothetical protein
MVHEARAATREVIGSARALLGVSGWGTRQRRRGGGSCPGTEKRSRNTNDSHAGPCGGVSPPGEARRDEETEEGGREGRQTAPSRWVSVERIRARVDPAWTSVRKPVPQAGVQDRQRTAERRRPIGSVPSSPFRLRCGLEKPQNSNHGCHASTAHRGTRKNVLTQEYPWCTIF